MKDAAKIFEQQKNERLQNLEQEIEKVETKKRAIKTAKLKVAVMTGLNASFKRDLAAKDHLGQKNIGPTCRRMTFDSSRLSQSLTEIKNARHEFKVISKIDRENEMMPGTTRKASKKGSKKGKKKKAQQEILYEESSSGSSSEELG